MPNSSTSTPTQPAGWKKCENGPAGDIVCVVGLKDTVTGDTLCETPHPILLEADHVRGIGRQPVDRARERRATRTSSRLSLEILQLEDPTFKVKADKDTGQTLMSGMGTLHLEVKKHRLERDFQVKVRVGKPRVSYREMLREPRKVTARSIGSATSRPSRNSRSRSLNFKS